MKYQVIIGATIIEAFNVNASDEKKAQAKAQQAFDKLHKPTSVSASYEVSMLQCKPEVDDALVKFGQKLRQLREAAGIEQAAFAKMLNLNPSSVNHWEAGRNWPTMDKIITLCSFFKVSVNDMTGH